MGFTASLRKVLFGTPFGEVFPPRPNPRPLSIDGRTAALRVLREYATQLTFYRANGRGLPPIPFQVKPENFHIEQPDGVVDMVTPSIVVIPGPNADFNAIGLNGYVEEDSVDVYAKNTVVQWQSEYNERIQLEVWASSKAERRALLAGLEVAFTPTEQMYGLRFTMPEYFDELVCFSLFRRRLDETDAGRNRRKAQLELEMRFTTVALVNCVTMRPQLVLEVDVDGDTNLPIDLDEPDGADPNADPDTGAGP